MWSVVSHQPGMTLLRVEILCENIWKMTRHSDACWLREENNGTTGNEWINHHRPMNTRYVLHRVFFIIIYVCLLHCVDFSSCCHNCHGLWNNWLNFGGYLDVKCLPSEGYCFLQLWTWQKLACFKSSGRVSRVKKSIQLKIQVDRNCFFCCNSKCAVSVPSTFPRFTFFRQNKTLWNTPY